VERKASESYLNKTITHSNSMLDIRPWFLRKIPDWDKKAAKEGGPDFFFAMGWCWIECIQAEQNVPFKAISDKQRRRLNNDGGYIYLICGPGNAPTNKRAFLVPWKFWREEEIKSVDQKSFSWPGDRIRNRSIDIFSLHELEWIGGVFIIPLTHSFWSAWWNYLKGQSEALERTWMTQTNLLP
jgi:hypothetical protein